MADFDAAFSDLDALPQAAVCQKLNLRPQADGTFVRQDGAQRLLLLPLGEILPWQKADTAIEARFIAGAAMALSWSADGHNAQAAHLGTQLPHHRAAQTLEENVWLTAESLGAWSLIVLHGAHEKTIFTPAPADWFPTPMAAPRGEA